MSANFQPDVYPYKETGSFRFWCQKVLPLVYDDSLSYYELLCKVVKYLNDVIANVDGLHDDVLSTNQAFYDLQEYVNNYFTNLDVQVEINNKLDAMALDGTLGTLMSPYVSSEIGGVVAEQIGDTVASQIDATVAGQIGDVVAEQIGTPAATATTAWLNEHVNPVGSAVIVDDSLSIEGAAADAKKTGSVVAELNNKLGESLFNNVIPFGRTITYNLSDLPVFSPNKYMRSDGTLGTGSVTTSCVTIPSKGVKRVTVIANADSHEFTLPVVLAINEIDKTIYQSIISFNESAQLGDERYTTFDVDNFDYNTQLIFNWIGRSGEAVVLPDTVTVTYYTEDEWLNKVNVQEVIDGVKTIYLSNLKTVASGYYMNSSGSNVSQSATNIKALSADSLDSITFVLEQGHATYPNTPLCVLKDSSENVVSYLVPNGSGTYKFEVNHDLAKNGTLYVNQYDTNEWKKKWGSKPPSSDVCVPYFATVEKRKLEPYRFSNYLKRPFSFANKVVEYIGDSITEGVVDTNPIVYTENTWAKLFSESVDVQSYVNHAKAGACYYDPTNSGVKSMLEQLQDVSTTPDVIFIAGGINDWLLGTTIANFKTAVSEVCTYLKNNYPNAKVIFITPVNQAGWQGSPVARPTDTIQAFRNAMSEIIIQADNGNFSIIQGDTFNFPDSTANSDYISAVFGDKLHPSELGYRTVYLTNLLETLC